MAGRGRFRPDLAASSATRWCGRPPGCSGRPASSIGRVSVDFRAEEDFDGEDEEDEIPAARAPRKKPAARAPSRRSSEKFDLPPISVLSLSKASDRQPLSRSELDSNSRALEGVLGDF